MGTDKIEELIMDECDRLKEALLDFNGRVRTIISLSDEPEEFNEIVEALCATEKLINLLY